MMVIDMSTIQKYLPYIYYDKQEPFYPREVGYTVFSETGRSPSFDRVIHIPDGVAFVIEYALYWDFDIGHLYDLEHVWVYVDNNGLVMDAEASFHGRYLKALLKDKSNVEDGTHIRLYSQPGKHAFLPHVVFFQLVPHLMEATDEMAGNDGLVVADIFKGQFKTDDHIDKMIQSYMARYKFRPSLEFEKHTINPSIVVPWDVLKYEIPIYIRAMLKEIRNDNIRLGEI